MTLVGFDIGVTLFLQIVTTLMIIGIYSVMTSLRERRDDHQSNCQMVLLASFLFDLHATVKDLKTLTGERQSAIDDPDGKFVRFSRALERFRSDGSLPDSAPAAVSTFGDHVLAVFSARPSSPSVRPCWRGESVAINSSGTPNTAGTFSARS